MRLARRLGALAALTLPVAGCAEIGPDYQRPAAIVPAAYKEIKGWKAATPRDAEIKGAWWTAFHDPVLNRLEAQIAVSNQTLKADEANYRAALALISEARASLFPSANFNPSFTRSNPSGDQLVAEAGATWTLDLWGKVRRSIEQQGDAAEASAADLANATLAAQSALALAYVQLRESESAYKLYADTLRQYQRSLDIAQNQYNAGTAAKSDVITAQAQLLAAQAQQINSGVARAQSEHAIAVLIGKPPAELSLASGELTSLTPSPPVHAPSSLLERRPDIASAERKMAEQNAAIGVAMAGYYPSLTLSGSAGYAGNPFIRQIAGENPVWSFGMALAQPLFNGGLTDAQVASARASYEASVASYRAAVLSAFQQVEDQLAAARIYGEEIKVQEEAAKDAQQAVEIALNEYRAGTQNFTTVVTAETAALSDQQTLLATRASRLTATVNLIVALGGGWNQSRPTGEP